MELIRNLSEDKGEITGEVYFPLFDRYIEINFEEGVPRCYVEKCVNNLNSLGEDIIANLCYFAFEFCKDVIKNYNEVEYIDDLKEIGDPKDILKYIRPVSLVVDMPENQEIPAINLYFKCDWDEDNDMQILIYNNQVVYVGVYDGLDPWQGNLSEWGNYVTGYRL